MSRSFYTHGKKVKHHLEQCKGKFFLHLKKMFYFFFNQLEFVLSKLFLRENDKDSAIPVVDTGHFGYRRFVSEVRTTLISLAIFFLPRGIIVLFCISLKHAVCLTNFDHH